MKVNVHTVVARLESQRDSLELSVIVMKIAPEREKLLVVSGEWHYFDIYVLSMTVLLVHLVPLVSSFYFIFYEYQVNSNGNVKGDIICISIDCTD